MAATVLFGPVPAAAPGFALANCGEVMIAAMLLRRTGVGCAFFDSTRSTLLFMLIAAVVAPALGGLGGATTGMLAFGKPWVPMWIDWVVGHGLGTLIATPLVLLATSGELKRWVAGMTPPDVARATLTLGLLALVTGAVFAQNRLPLLFLPLLPALVATFQLGQPGAAMAVLLVATIGGGLTLAGLGPVMLLRGSAVLRLQFFQVYLASTFLMSLPVAAALRQRERALAQVRAGEARYRLLADSVTDMILEIAPDGRVRYASTAVQDLLGIAPADLEGRFAEELLMADDAGRVFELYQRALALPGTIVTAEFRLRRADGEPGWFESRTRAVEDGEGRIEGAVSILREVSDRKALEQHLRKAAETDPLTGLANRRALVRRLDAALAAAGPGQPVSLAIVDVDFFKRVNDEHGHAAGDTALMIVADICRVMVRADDLVARIGGEEFALLLAGADAAAAARIGERLRETLATAPIPLSDGSSVLVTVSVGVAEQAPDEDARALMARADAALYRAKAGGRNRLVVAAP